MGRKRSNLEKVPGVRIWKRTKDGARAKWKITYREPGAAKETTKAVSADYEITVEKAKAVRARVDRIANGLAQPRQERWLEHDQMLITKHLDDYEQFLKDCGRESKHVRQMVWCARAILLGVELVKAVAKKEKRKRGSRVSIPTIRLPLTGWLRVSSIDLTKLRRQVARVKEQRSAATANRYLDAVRAFLSWGSPERWGENVALEVVRYNAATDRRRVRRIIAPEQFIQLINATEAEGSPIRARLTGHERARIYLTCLAAGLRSKESRLLKVKDLRLTGHRRGIELPAALAKNRKQTFMPLPEWVIDDLAEAVAGKDPDAPALKVPTNTARMLKADLEAAGIAYRTHEGYFDFHAIRHESGALLISAGVNPKRVQTHMRHSRITLTMDTYGHIMPDERDTTVQKLPDFGRSKAQRNAQRGSVNDSPQTSANVRDQNRKNEKTPINTGVQEWSDGESNPDLLNAIQPSKSRIVKNHRSVIKVGEKARSASRSADALVLAFGGSVTSSRRLPGKSKARQSVKRLIAKVVREGGSCA